VDGAGVTQLVEQDLAAAHDPSVRDVVRQFRVEPHSVELDWIYGPPYRRYVCWVVLDGLPWNGDVGLVYCPEGFGPDRPWGLVFLRGPRASMGIADAWYPTLEGFVRDNWCPTGDGGGPPGGT
jgi:hypothetical protein